MKRKIIIITLIVVLIIVGIFVINMKLKNNDGNDVVDIYDGNNDNDIIGDDYVALFHGAGTDMNVLTYIYKIDNGKANYGFEYINATTKTASWGSSEWKTEITSRGKFDWTDEAFKIAEDNGAYSFVTLPNDRNTYTIEDFQKIFIKN